MDIHLPTKKGQCDTSIYQISQSLEDTGLVYYWTKSHTNVTNFPFLGVKIPSLAVTDRPSVRIISWLKTRPSSLSFAWSHLHHPHCKTHSICNSPSVDLAMVQEGRGEKRKICQLLCLMRILSSILLDRLKWSHWRQVVRKQVVTITHTEKKRLKFSHP